MFPVRNGQSIDLEQKRNVLLREFQIKACLAEVVAPCLQGFCILMLFFLFCEFGVSYGPYLESGSPGWTLRRTIRIHS